jgi:hypothetical protein
LGTYSGPSHGDGSVGDDLSRAGHVRAASSVMSHGRHGRISSVEVEVAVWLRSTRGRGGEASGATGLASSGLGGLPLTPIERYLNSSAMGKTPNWSLVGFDSRRGGVRRLSGLMVDPGTRRIGHW